MQANVCLRANTKILSCVSQTVVKGCLPCLKEMQETSDRADTVYLMTSDENEFVIWIWHTRAKPCTYSKKYYVLLP